MEVVSRRLVVVMDMHCMGMDIHLLRRDIPVGDTLRKELIRLEAILSTVIITRIRGKFPKITLYSKLLVLYTYQFEQLSLLYSNSNAIADRNFEAESTREDSELKIS